MPACLLPLSDLFLTDVPKQRWSLVSLEKRRLLPFLNSECFTPGCIDFSYYCRSVRGNWIGNCRNTLLFHFWHLYFLSHLVLHSQKSALKQMGREAYCQDSWMIAPTLASLITLSSNAKGYTHPCGFRPQWFTFMKALSPFLCRLPSLCARG